MADTTDDTAAGTTENKWDREQSPEAFVGFWLERIELAEKAEEAWRKRAAENAKRYANESKVQIPGISTSQANTAARTFNIFATNVDTIVPAIINSPPAPDVRRRFGDSDEAGKLVAQVLERCLTVALDQFPVETVLRDCEKDNEIVGRGVLRVRYGDENGEQRVWLENVDWRDFVRGPAKAWGDVPFEAFRDYLTREQLRQINPDLADLVEMDAKQSGADDKDKERGSGGGPGDAMKRAIVWQIWDRERREMVQIATGYRKAPLAVVPDPMRLENFFPIPNPLYAIKQPHNLEPIDPLRQYQDQADELNDITQRLTKLVRAARWRGVANAGLSAAFSQLKSAADGEIVPSTNAQEFREGEIDKSIWMMPVEKLVALIDKLYLAREEVKKTIFEITGVADIMRGDTQASETATAQRIKAQWGSLRIQQRQADMQRLCRDCMRMMAEIVCSFFTPQTIKAMTGIDLSPAPPEVVAQAQAAIQQAQMAAAQAQQPQAPGMPAPPAPQPPKELVQLLEQEKVKAEALRILKSDALRDYRVDVETDSTIRADLARSQENFGTFIQGLGQFFTAVAPAVQAGAMPLPIAIKILTGMGRSFKLGRQAEDAMDEWAKMAEQNPQMGQQQPDQGAAAAAQVEAKARQEEHQMDMAGRQADLQAKQAGHAMDLQAQQAKLGLEAQKVQIQGAAMAQKAALAQSQPQGPVQ